MVQTSSSRQHRSGRRTDDVPGTGFEERPRRTSYPVENTCGRRTWRRERITAESKICSAVFTGQDACTVCCILDSSGKRESSFYIKGGREYANASRQIYDRIKRSEDVQGGGGNAKANYRYWKKLKNLHEHYAHQISRQIINYCKIQNASILVRRNTTKTMEISFWQASEKIPHFVWFRPSEKN